MLRKLIITALLFIGIFLGSCKEDSSDKIAQKEIRDILYDISVDFNLKNMYGIMEHLHTDYLHKGKIAYHFNTDWLDLMAQYSLLEIDVLYIELQDSKAIVHLRKKFSSSYETMEQNDPEDNGDISYFYRENGVWYVYGNQLWLKKGVQRSLPVPSSSHTVDNLPQQ